ncbi:hypothetical protein AB7813_14740 [Tardiphaga sp. 20_F10_N6_6]|uniref:hypothetical protein n=1 Tax=Tardiphaga sp. 20_F10_N6_6 TaxID=3240788 RepID=UPI003F8A28C4
MPKTPEIISINLPRLYERDIDVLLQEELLFNDRVCDLFSRAIGVSSTISINECLLSVIDETGETDLLARFSVDGASGVLLIENKIDAVFQPRQPERYKERAEAFLSDGRLVFCILISPAKYSEVNAAAKLFDIVVTYEDVALAIGDLGTARAQHRASLLLRAVQQGRKPSFAIPAPEVTNLWQRVYRTATAEFPQLMMKKPDDKGSDSWWLIFKGDLPKFTTIDWKVKNGFVDLSYWRGATNRPTELSAAPTGARFLVIGTTTVFRVEVSKPPELWSTVSDEQIRESLGVAARLLDFHRSQ